MRRLEDPDLLRGKARFIDDIHLPDLLEAAFVRSPHAHALFARIDKEAALALPGVRAVLTLEDLRPLLATERLVVGLPSPSYRQTRDRPVLAAGEAVYVGESVALVVAEGRALAEDAAAAVEVAWEPLSAVADARTALAPGAPIAHRGAPHNLLAEFAVSYGDVERAFAAAAHRVALDLRAHRGGSHSLEGRGVVAWRNPIDGVLTVMTSTQTPHMAQRLLGDILGLDERGVRVVVPDVGGGFGPKLVFYPEEAAVAAASLLLERPIKWAEDRREHFIATTQERDQFWHIEMGLDADARILGIRGTMLHDHGAYTARGVNLAQNSAQAVTLPYEVPAFHLAVRLALTNTVPVTPVRGAGQPQGVFAMERLLDKAARAIGIDRAEIRRRNLVPPDRMPCKKPLVARGGIGVVLDSGDYPKCQDLALQHSEYRDFRARQERAQRQGRYLGIGIANFVKGTGRGPFESARVRIGASGRIEVASGASAMGQGTRTMLAEIVAAEFGADPGEIAVCIGDTAAIPLGIGGSNSRQAVTAGSSAHLSARAVKKKALSVAAQMLEAAEEDLEIADGAVRVKGAPQMNVPLGKVARALGGLAGYPLPPGVLPGLEAAETMLIDEMAYANGTAVAEVEVDPETGGVTLVRLVIAHDCGRMLNPMIVEGQVLGGAAHGIGNALYEWMGFDESGQPVTTSFADYLLPGAVEVPRITLVHQETLSPLNPLGVKGVGECGVLPMPSAIIAAVEDALAPFAVEIAQFPIRPHEIVALIKASKRT